MPYIARDSYDHSWENPLDEPVILFYAFESALIDILKIPNEFYPRQSSLLDRGTMRTYGPVVWRLSEANSLRQLQREWNIYLCTFQTQFMESVILSTEVTPRLSLSLYFLLWYNVSFCLPRFLLGPVQWQKAFLSQSCLTIGQFSRLLLQMTCFTLTQNERGKDLCAKVRACR